MVRLSVIVPVRLTPRRPELLERLAFAPSDPATPEGVEFLVVDDASPDPAPLMERCEALGLRYVATGADPSSPFNLARARNRAAEHAKGELLLFLDVDLVPYPGFYADLLREAELLDIGRRIDRFLMCPVIYLAEAGWQTMQAQEPANWRAFAISAMVQRDRNLMEKFSHGTSCVAVNRHFYLSLGGQNEAFEGWGYEDYEFGTRLIQQNPQFRRPALWAWNGGNFRTKRLYAGWKASYRLYGDWLAAKGIYLLHAPHPPDSGFREGEPANLRRLHRHLRRGSKAEHPPPLAAAEAGRSLVLRQNPFNAHRVLTPWLGECVPIARDEPLSPRECARRIAAERIDRLVFANPYASERDLALYRWARAEGFPFLIGERGALPDAIVHERTGFHTDSTAFERALWDQPLSDDATAQTEAYLDGLQRSGSAVERQPKRQKTAPLRQRLGIAEGQKILFVPFQQPNDTVLRYFAGAIGSFEAFHRLIASLPTSLGPGWTVVVKKHPAERHLPPIAGAVVADDAHITDLIAMADAVAVVNSGTGLLALLQHKPVLALGEAWYTGPGLATAIAEPQRLAAILKDGAPPPDRETLLRFAHYLRFRYYSFGRQYQRPATMPDGSPITSTTRIDYSELRGWTDKPLFLGDRSHFVAFYSQIYDRYGPWRHAPLAVPAALLLQARRAVFGLFRGRR